MSDETTAVAIIPLGIENLKKAIKLGIDLGQQINTSFADGYQWTDLLSFMPLATQIPGVIKSGADVVKELKDLSPEERDELNKYVQVNFDIPNDHVEGIIEDAASIVFSLVSFVLKLQKAAEPTA